MGYWNHRVVKQVINGEDFYSIREVFYNGNNSIWAYTEEPIEISGSSIDELREYLQWCLGCLDKPVLIDGEVKFFDTEEDKNNLPLDSIDDL